MSSTDRQELIRNAILFLNDPKVQSSSLTSRIQFLESKGLNEDEIQRALSLAEGSGSQTAQAMVPGRPSYPSPAAGYGNGNGYDYAVANPPLPPRRDWRDLFIMAVISGGVVYGLTTLAKKYLLPHLQPPSSTSFQNTSTSLNEQYDEAFRLLTELNDQTGKLQSSIEEDRERVNGVVGEVEDAIKGVRGAEERWREEMRDVRGEVESLRELVPKMIEKHTQTQSSALTDLQAELRSLKTLLISRQPQTQQPNTNGSGSTNANGNGVSSTTAAANALLGSRSGRASIPAWQMAPSAVSSGTSTPSVGMGASGLFDKKEGDKENESEVEVKEGAV